MKRNRIFFKRDTGITIIALIITIIILSIIAGTSIVYVNNGALGEAKRLKSEAEKQHEIEIIRQRLSEIYAEKEGDFLTLADVVDVVKTLDGNEVEKDEVIDAKEVELSAGYDYYLVAENQEFLIDEIGGTIGGYLIKKDLNAIIARRIKYQVLGLLNMIARFNIILNDTGSGNGTIGLSITINEGTFDILKESEILSTMVDGSLDDLNMKAGEIEGKEIVIPYTLQYEGIAGDTVQFTLPEGVSESIHMLLHTFSIMYAQFIGNVDTDDILEGVDFTEPINIEFFRIDEDGLMQKGDNSEPINHFISLEISNGFLGKKAILCSEISRLTGEANTNGLCPVTEDKDRYGEPHPIASFISSLTTPSDGAKGWGYKTSNDRALFFSNVEGTTRAPELADQIRDLVDPLIEMLNTFAEEDSRFNVNPVFFEKLITYIETIVAKSKLYVGYSGQYVGGKMNVDEGKVGSTLLYLYFKGSPRIYINLFECAELSAEAVTDDGDDYQYSNSNIIAYTIDWSRYQSSIYDNKDAYMDLSLYAAPVTIGGRNPTYGAADNIISQEDLELLATNQDAYSSIRLLTQGSVSEPAKLNDELLINCKVYNEALTTKNGTVGTAKVLVGYIPEGLEFDENNETNIKYGWAKESDNVIKTSYLADKPIQPFNPEKNEEGNYVINYEEVEVVFKVKDVPASVNEDEDKNETPHVSPSFEIFESEGPDGIQDIDSTAGNLALAAVNFMEDDNDTVQFDLREDLVEQAETGEEKVGAIIVQFFRDAIVGAAQVILNGLMSFMDGGIKSLTVFITTYPKAYTLVTMSQVV